MKQWLREISKATVLPFVLKGFHDSLLKRYFLSIHSPWAFLTTDRAAAIAIVYI